MKLGAVFDIVLVLLNKKRRQATFSQTLKWIVLIINLKLFIEIKMNHKHC